MSFYLLVVLTQYCSSLNFKNLFRIFFKVCRIREERQIFNLGYIYIYIYVCSLNKIFLFENYLLLKIFGIHLVVPSLRTRRISNEALHIHFSRRGSFICFVLYCLPWLVEIRPGTWNELECTVNTGFLSSFLVSPTLPLNIL